MSQLQATLLLVDGMPIAYTPDHLLLMKQRWWSLEDAIPQM